MKFIHNSFDNYLRDYDRQNLHPKLSNVFDCFPNDLSNMQNIIMYGPSESYKYTQFLQSIRKYSASKLKYEKKINIDNNKQEFFIKISDIHYEIDMSILGCNARILWNDIFNQIVDIILTKTKKNGIILCKNFHTIHSELLDIFYSYMQKNINNHYNIIFFLLTDHISFIPDNILNCSKVVSIPKVLSQSNNLIFKNNVFRNIKLDNRKCIRTIRNNIDNLSKMNITLYKKIISHIINFQKINFLTLRESLYDLLIYNVDVHSSLWYIIEDLIKNNHIKEDMLCEINIEVYKFFKLYNNNYRPIYHLELLILNIIKQIHHL